MKNFITRLTVTMAASASVFLPVSAFAYLSPSQVFGGQSDTIDRTDPTTYQAPPQQREGAQVIEEQQQRAASSRAAVQEQEFISDDEEFVDTYVPPAQTASSLGLFDETTQYEARKAKMHQAAGSPTIIIGGDGTVVDGKGNVLHSGAPRVTATGPESILTFSAMILAAVSTIGFAFVKAKRMHMQA